MADVKAVIKASVKELFHQKRMDGKRLFVFGLNCYTECINNFLYEEGCRISAVLDNDKGKQGKDVIDILVLAPDSIYWGRKDIVLIASKHEKSMREQIRQLSDGMAETVSLVDLVQHIEDREKSEKFWLDENYTFQMQQLCLGEEVYRRIKQREPLILCGSSLGDIFLLDVYLPEYQKKTGFKDIKFVVSSNGAYHTARVFGMDRVEKITEKENAALIKFILFLEKTGEAVWGPNRYADAMAYYKKIAFPRCWAKYILRLDEPYQLNFPSIWEGGLNEAELLEKGMAKGKSVILAPYANSVAELPLQFWEILAKKLWQLDYFVFTNIAGSQRPVEGTWGIEIPLEQIGSYLEYAGYFIALRSGLCDIAGHSRCKQIVILRENVGRRIPSGDIHTDHISDHAIQYIYCDSDFNKNVECILRFVTDTKQ